MTTTVLRVHNLSGQIMPTKTTDPARQKKETWLDPPWTRPGDPEPERLYTRDELAARLQGLNVQASAADLRFWEARTILPQAVRRRHHGATRTIYPDWYGYLVRRLRQLQSAGYSLQSIKEKIRGEASLLIRGGEPEDLYLPTTASNGLYELAQMYTAASGTRVTRIEVRLMDEQGAGAVWEFDLATNERPGFSSRPLRSSRN
jgi:hypothetical protein